MLDIFNALYGGIFRVVDSAAVLERGKGTGRIAWAAGRPRPQGSLPTYPNIAGRRSYRRRKDINTFVRAPSSRSPAVLEWIALTSVEPANCDVSDPVLIAKFRIWGDSGSAAIVSTGPVRLLFGIYPMSILCVCTNSKLSKMINQKHHKLRFTVYYRFHGRSPLILTERWPIGPNLGPTITCVISSQKLGVVNRQKAWDCL
jgi:hypothetical protein